MVFGKASGFAASTDLESLDDSGGFRIEGIDKNDKADFSVSSAGDVNGDGNDDIIIGAPEAATKKGESYVIFGGDFTGDSTISSGSGEDIVRNTHSLSRSLSESRANPLTPGNPPVLSISENRDLCLGTRSLIIPSRGTATDLITGHTGSDSDTDDDKQAY